MLLFSFIAMKTRNVRSWLYLLAQLTATLGALLLWKLPKTAKGGLLFAVYIMPTTGAGYGVLMGHSIANTSGYTKRSLASSGLYVGYCLGNFIGPLVFLDKEAPSYSTGFIVTFICALIAGLLAVVYRYKCVWDNRTRDRAGFVEGFDHAYEDPTDREVSGHEKDGIAFLGHFTDFPAEQAIPIHPLSGGSPGELQLAAYLPHAGNETSALSRSLQDRRQFGDSDSCMPFIYDSPVAIRPKIKQSRSNLNASRYSFFLPDTLLPHTLPEQLDFPLDGLDSQLQRRFRDGKYNPTAPPLLLSSVLLLHV
jgi:hypothetical protein